MRALTMIAPLTIVLILAVQQSMLNLQSFDKELALFTKCQAFIRFKLIQGAREYSEYTSIALCPVHSIWRMRRISFHI